MHLSPQFRTINPLPVPKTEKTKYVDFERILPFKHEDIARDFAKKNSLRLEKQVSSGCWKEVVL